MLALLRTFSWQDLRHHPWRSLAAVTAVMLGVALAFAVHVINTSALDEFAQAVRSINGQPDLEVRAMHGSLPEGLYTQVVQHTQVAQASPWLELTALGVWPGNAGQAPASTPLQVLGADALLLPTMAPALMPQPWPAADRLAMLAPATVFLNPAALQALGWPQTPQGSTLPTLQLRTATGTHTVQVAGTVAAGGPPVAVMDIAAAQDLFARHGQISRIDLQWQPGTQVKALADSLRALPGWPPQALLAAPGDATERISNLSRAYRVNLTVLALVALFTGAYLVFSVRALSVAQRAQQWALLAVLGATPRQRLLLVLAESAALGLAGSMAGVALGTALAAAALRLLGGDLGGGYFAGVQPALQWSLLAALGYGLLGVLAALVGGWWPARAAQQLAPAATLKGLGTATSATPRGLPGLCMLAAGAALTQVPPISGVPLAAYVAVGLLLVGGIAVLPWGVGHLLAALQPLVAQRPLPLLALERARRMRGQAAMAVGGVVASLSLAVALTVMVGSFRGSVMQWLDVVLPSPLYARSALHAAGGDAALLPPGLAQAAAQLPNLARVQTLRTSPLQLHPAQPALTVISRPLGGAPAQHLPLVGNALPVPQGQVGVYVSEAAAHLYQRNPGQAWPELSQAFFKDFSASALENQAPLATFFIAGIWRDYARQTGAVVIDSADYQALTGDARISDLALWPREGADLAQLQADLQRLAAQGLDAAAQPLEFSSAATIRERSLHIFDRSFAVTYWLQAVAIGIGLFGVAASFSAQVLARRKEFGLLAHLGLTRRQILAVVAGEGAAWTALGAAAGLLLGLAVAVVLVHVVNPQSFYWTMELQIPALRLLALCAAVVAAGTATAWLAGRAAAGRHAILAVKEDW